MHCGSFAVDDAKCSKVTFTLEGISCCILSDVSLNILQKLQSLPSSKGLSVTVWSACSLQKSSAG